MEAKKVRCTLQADHEDAVHTYCHFLLAINTDLICSISESMIKHEPDKKSITCTRILSLRGGHKNSPTEGPQWPAMMLRTYAAISFWLTIQTSSIVYPRVWSHMRCTKRASFAQELRHCVVTTKTPVWKSRNRPTTWCSCHIRPFSFGYQYRPHLYIYRSTITH
jgi:hypothetical protein